MSNELLNKRILTRSWIGLLAFRWFVGAIMLGNLLSAAYIEPSNLQQINVNIGPSFNSYAGGMAGGMNFKLANPELSKVPQLNGMLGTGYESNSQAVQTLASLQYSTEKFAFLVNGIFRKAQNYKAAERAIVPNSQFQKWNGSIAATYKLNSKNQLL